MHMYVLKFDIIFIGNDVIQISNIYTHISLTKLRRECGDLDELLISPNDIEFNEVLGEGTYLLQGS